MTYFFGLTIFFIGIAGMGGLVALKMPELRSARFKKGQRRGFRSYLFWARRRLLEYVRAVPEYISWEIVLQKALSKIKLIALRVETWSNKWLCQIRERSRREKESEVYWKKLSKLSKGKKGRKKPA